MIFVKNCLIPVISLLGLAFVGNAAHAQENDSVYQTVKLEEVTVKGVVPQIKTKNGLTSIKIKGTVLEKMGDLFSMLANTPGLHRQDESIVVNGLGDPVFVINGREVKDPKILKTYKADNISKIEIDKAPIGEYADVQRPVVKITTVKSLNDNLYLAVNGDLTKQQKLSAYYSITARTNIKNYYTEATYSSGPQNALLRETYFRRIYHDDYTFTATQSRKYPMKMFSHTIRWNNEWDITPHHRLGFEYVCSLPKDHFSPEGTDISQFKSTTEEKYIKRVKDVSRKIHSFTLEYNFNTKNHALQFVQDFATNHSNTDLNVTETPSTNPNMITQNKSDYKISTSLVKYDASIHQFNLIAWARYNYIYSNTLSRIHNDLLPTSLFSQNSIVKESSPILYASLSRTFKNLNVTAGLRYIYTSRKLTYADNSNPKSSVDVSQSSFIPYLNIKYAKGDFSAYLLYTGSRSDPSFKQMNSGITYQDSLTYE
ncbi:MAG: outer membrane beta-barrel protein, partial [Bacteroidaceae bacterium]|nr:outer membrane beta-barrel protein [Bacteroidaceae bacterium]